MKLTHTLLNPDRLPNGVIIPAGTHIAVEEYTNNMVKCESPTYGIFYSMKRDVAVLPHIKGA